MLPNVQNSTCYKFEFRLSTYVLRDLPGKRGDSCCCREVADEEVTPLICRDFLLVGLLDWGMYVATMIAAKTRIAPNANGGPGITCR